MNTFRTIETDAALPEIEEEGMRPALARGVLAAIWVGVLLLFVAAGVLWVQHGTTVFFDTLAAGLATCF